MTPSNNSLFQYKHVKTLWSSAENINGVKGAGGAVNQGAKGRPSVSLAPGQSFDLLDWEGMGLITRIWLTIQERSPEMLRSLRIDIFWDGGSKPAVSAPLGDFFGIGLGRTAAFESELFTNPEGRSFNCFIPMPFKKSARITVTNDSDQRVRALFFDINLLALKEWHDDYLYFHCYWSRDLETTLAQDFELLPRISGRGRYLGVNVGVNANPAYEDTWWGEGEVKLYVDGDGQLPTLVGTGTEDYIGTGWGQGRYATRFMGSPIADKEKKQWAFYRYHVPDPVYFAKDIRITLQQMGGGPVAKVAALQKSGAPLIPVTILVEDEIRHIFDPRTPVDLDDLNHPNCWTNFYRSDDVSATTYFYLDKPENELPELPGVDVRTASLKTGE